MERLYCPKCGNYLEGGDGSMTDCSCGWKQERATYCDCDRANQDATEQSLAEIRRAERERCAQMAESYAYMSENFKALAEEIRQMED